MTKDQRILLENVIESLNRLFDGDSSVIDVHDLLFATSVALRASSVEVSFESPLRDLREILASKMLPDQKRDSALLKTDDLRKQIAVLLKLDAIENPKQRHAIGKHPLR